MGESLAIILFVIDEANGLIYGWVVQNDDLFDKGGFWFEKSENEFIEKSW